MKKFLSSFSVIDLACLTVTLGAGLLVALEKMPAAFADPTLFLALFSLAAGLFLMPLPLGMGPLALLLFGAHLGAYALITVLHAGVAATVSLWMATLACWLGAWAATRRIAWTDSSPLTAVLVPLLFGLWLLILWEIVVHALKIPRVLLPPPSAIFTRFVQEIPTLAADFRQTFLKAVLAGYALGNGAGFVFALLIDQRPFLKRGLLPLGNLVSALPIIGIAPIMVMWFGFDWPSKAAVVTVMTFFPMLVNTLTGLDASGKMERDLMRTYGASHGAALLKLRLPAAMPFIFNALKINTTLALIGAIVAEFFGTPIVGMGFRINTEAGRMALDMVWAEIALAALAGSLFYGLVGAIERAVTFWHPSFRARAAGR